jgi:hypothetical protein
MEAGRADDQGNYVSAKTLDKLGKPLPILVGVLIFLIRGDLHSGVPEIEFAVVQPRRCEGSAVHAEAGLGPFPTPLEFVPVGER